MQSTHSPADIRDILRRSQTPIYFINSTVANLLGADEWINRLSFINTVDSFEGCHPNVFVPADARTHGLHGVAAANNYLLNHRAVADHIRTAGAGGIALFLMFDTHAEALARNVGLTVCFPPATLRHCLDNKVTTTHLANQAGIPSVPHVLTRVDSYATLRQVARTLGPDLVVQLPYGDSGTTTFFVATEAEFRPYARQITAQPTVKIMQRIRCHQATIEGCVTRYGTLVGPLMTELIGFAALTPQRGGWGGNEVFSAGASRILTPDIRRQAQHAAMAIGERIRQEGYWGYFGLDLLIDQDTGQLYLGELNPRITGATPLTTQVALDQNDVPLLFFHLLEWFGVEYALDASELNHYWVTAEGITQWSQLIIERTEDSEEVMGQVPRSGIWRMAPDGTLQFSRTAFEMQPIASEAEAFFIRTIDRGHTPGKGCVIGRLLTRGRLMTDDYELTERAKAWIDGLRALFVAARAPHDLPIVSV